MRTGEIRVIGMGSFWTRPVGTSVQELWVAGGLEGYILKKIGEERA